MVAAWEKVTVSPTQSNRIPCCIPAPLGPAHSSYLRFSTVELVTDRLERFKPQTRDWSSSSVELMVITSDPNRLRRIPYAIKRESAQRAAIPRTNPPMLRPEPMAMNRPLKACPIPTPQMIRMTSMAVKSPSQLAFGPTDSVNSLPALLDSTAISDKHLDLGHIPINNTCREAGGPSTLLTRQKSKSVPHSSQLYRDEWEPSLNRPVLSSHGTIHPAQPHSSPPMPPPRSPEPHPPRSPRTHIHSRQET